MTQTNSPQAQLVRRTLAKLEKSQKNKREFIRYLEESKSPLLKHTMKTNRLKECGNVVTFRKHLETGEKQLLSANFCKYDRVCIACATKRAIGMIKRFEQGIKAQNLYEKHRYYIVLTIKHKAWDTLEDLMAKLLTSKEKLARNYRNSKRDMQKNKSFFSVFDGMVISIEVAHKWKNGWHPHINILACSSKEVPIKQGAHLRWDVNEHLQNERLQITWDSFIHNIRKINVKNDYFTRSWIGEVFKYAIKFSDLTTPQLATIMELQQKYQYRFFSTYGIFRWWKLEKKEQEKGKWHEGSFLYSRTSNGYNLQ